MAQLFTPIIFSVFFLSACQKNTENPQDNLKPSISHQTVIEKAVIVPPAVSRRWKSIKLAVIDKTLGTKGVYEVPIGKPFTVSSSSLTIDVEVFLPAFTMEGGTITSSSNELVNPGAKIRISENGTPVFQGWLFSKFQNTHVVTHPKLAFILVGAVPR